MAKVQMRGEPVKDGGVGDQQALRILLLVATTGRRLSEILLLDRDPLLPFQEREFLRFNKIAADGRELELDPADLYQLLELDKRADRILPNGRCLLPPRQVRERGNACLTCHKFATDRSYLSEHEQQLDLVGQLVNTRMQAFEARTGREMTDENIWLAERRTEQHAREAQRSSPPTSARFPAGARSGPARGRVSARCRGRQTAGSTGWRPRDSLRHHPRQRSGLQQH